MGSAASNRTSGGGGSGGGSGGGETRSADGRGSRRLVYYRGRRYDVTELLRNYRNYYNRSSTNREADASSTTEETPVYKPPQVLNNHLYYTYLPYKVNPQYVHFRLLANYFLIAWKIPYEISRQSVFFNN